MKLLYASDLHGSVDAAKHLIRAIGRHRPDEVILLGDILSGRNWSSGVKPRAVTQALRSVTCPISLVRGNCDTSRDERALEKTFSAYDVRRDGERTIFASHGHLYGDLLPESVTEPDLILTGHTHRWRLEQVSGIVRCNVGSLGFPRGGNTPTYALYSDGIVSVFEKDGELMAECQVNVVHRHFE